jgi:arylsulfatase A-like enzyme
MPQHIDGASVPVPFFKQPLGQLKSDNGERALNLHQVIHRAACQAMWLTVGLVVVCHARVSHGATATPRGDARQPNIIFILADDLGYGDVGCYGQKRIKTPSIDRMAAEGLRFTDAYAGAPVCAPSRCVLMTGRHMGHARVRGNTPNLLAQSLRADDVTIASVLKDAGYATALIGKWGLGDPQQAPDGLPRRHGFDYFFGYLRQGHAHNYYTDYLWRNEEKVKLPNVISKDPALKHNVAEKKVQYTHDLFAEEGLKFVREHKDGPFFLYWALTIPHANDEAGDRGMEVPEYGEYANLDWPEPQKGHAAMISRMDRDIGRMLALLKELGIDDNTLVIFTSDNGPHREGGNDPDFNDSNGPLRGYKGNVTEGGIREPFIARWPGHVPAGKTNASPITFADMLPTLADIGSGQTPAGLDGVDIAPSLAGKTQPALAERFLYWEFYKDGVQAQSSRWRHWKAVRDPQSKKIELYDLTTDIGESHDVAAEHPDVVKKFEEFFGTARTESRDWPMKAEKAPSGKAKKNKNAAQAA